MTYRGYTIRRGEVVQVAERRRKGTYDVVDGDGKEVHLVSYTLGNHLSRTTALRRAKEWIDERLLRDGSG